MFYFMCVIHIFKSKSRPRSGKCWQSAMHVHYKGLWKGKLHVREKCAQSKGTFFEVMSNNDKQKAIICEYTVLCPI